MTLKTIVPRLLQTRLLARFLKNEGGATAIEYGLIAAGIAVAIIAVVGSMGSDLNTSLTTISDGLD